MKFITTRDGTITNTAHIVGITDYSTARLTNGKQVEVNKENIEELEASAIILPALPGYRAVRQDEDSTVWLEDVIAWKISGDGEFVQPITRQGVSNKAVLSPDGSVHHWEGSWDSLASYLAAEKKK